MGNWFDVMVVLAGGKFFGNRKSVLISLMKNYWGAVTVVYRYSKIPEVCDR